ncbi:MAG TPA: LPXTG cell wall anchor domain-containing protein, partial [Candidatus Nitrosotalea sp.]|nr:LPXTG cell wall anchor domain-containing protein [Candidatus Nitrosotalea sp.]
SSDSATVGGNPPSSDNSGVSGSGLNPSSDNTSTYLVIGGIIAAGIAGIVIVKKTRSKVAPKPKP